jgi:hypothetical protein
MYNNVIIASASSAYVCGLVLSNSINGNVCNNTFVVSNGVSGYTYGISSVLSSTSGFILNNNIVNTKGVSDTYCMASSSSTHISDCSANLFLNSNSASPLIYFYKNGYIYTWAESGTFFGLFSNSSSLNISGDPCFVSSSDFHLQGTSPAKGTGMNGSSWTNFPVNASLEPIDLDQNTRPPGSWSIGAYQ